MRIMNLRLYDKPGNLKAFLDVETDEGFLMKGFKIMDGRNGLFVTPPSEKATDGKYYPRVRIPAEISDKLLEQALSAFKEEGGTTSTEIKNDSGPFPF